MKIWTFTDKNTQNITMILKIFFSVLVCHLADMPICFP